MAEYISRDAAIELCDWYEHEFTEVGDYFQRFNAELRSIPAADVRPVVLCKDCKHWFDNGTDYCSCDRDALIRHKDFFCAAGERRSNAEVY